MEKLYIKNFLVIKEAELDIGKINIIIGSQASGKSIVAKLIFLFREICNDLLLGNIHQDKTLEDLRAIVEIFFEKYFSRYIWIHKEFCITYTHNQMQISISKLSTQKKIKIAFNDIFINTHQDLIKKYKNFTKDIKKEDIPSIRPLSDFVQFHASKNSKVANCFDDLFFISAGRSFFTSLQINIFSLLTQNVDIDVFMKHFGNKYGFAKSLYNDFIFPKIITNKNKYNKAKSLVNKILVGEYFYEDEQDWIKMKNVTTKLVDTSSGQQESLPMLLILLVYPFINTFSNSMRSKEKIFFIEEPEAHLFPTSQKYIVSLIALLYNQNHKNVITTHSPYILTALNNLILANDVKNEKGEDSIKNIVDKDFCVDFDEVRAYTIKNGKLKSILDKKNRLIGINVIDDVSDDFNDTFDKLLSL